MVDVLLVSHQRAWAFQKSLHRVPIVNWRLRTPLPYRHLLIGMGLVGVWFAGVALFDLGVTGGIVTLAGPILAYRHLVSREARGAGVVPVAVSWAGTCTVVARAAVRRSPSRVRVSSRARVAGVQAPWGATAASARTAVALTFGASSPGPVLDQTRLPLVEAVH